MPTRQCPRCHRNFKNLELHITKAHTNILIVINADRGVDITEHTTASFLETRCGESDEVIDLGIAHSDSGEWLEWQTQRNGTLYVIHYYIEPTNNRVELFTEDKDNNYQNAFPNWIAHVHLLDKTVEQYNAKGRVLGTP